MTMVMPASADTSTVCPSYWRMAVAGVVVGDGVGDTIGDGVGDGVGGGVGEGVGEAIGLGAGVGKCNGGAKITCGTDVAIGLS